MTGQAIQDPPGSDPLVRDPPVRDPPVRDPLLGDPPGRRPPGGGDPHAAGRRNDRAPAPPERPALHRPPVGPQRSWSYELESEILSNLEAVVEDNACPDRFFGRVGPVVSNDGTLGHLAFYRKLAPAIDWVMAALCDGASRQVLSQVLAFRALGATRYRIAGSERFAPRLAAARALCQGPGEIPLPLFPGGLFEVPFEGETLRLESWALNIQACFFERQYYLERAGLALRPEPGEVVLDLGGCFGDTALGFAASVGEGGRVVSFEPSESNLAVFRRNLALNPVLGARVALVTQPADAEAGRLVRFAEASAGSRIDGSGTAEHRTTTVDATVAALGLDRVDMIKMDIEGAELPALQGAAETIRRHRPKLALACYHGWQLFDLVAHLRRAVPDYLLFVAHHSQHAEETVLYAAPDARLRAMLAH